MGLEALPDSDIYVKRSNPGQHSPDVFYGTPEMNRRLTRLAKLYRDWYYSEHKTWVKLSFNDLSLPYWGLYDIKNDWACPHQLHRLGRSVDVNQYAYTDDGEPVLVEKRELDKFASAVGLTEKHTNPSDTRMHLELE